MDNCIHSRITVVKWVERSAKGKFRDRSCETIIAFWVRKKAAQGQGKSVKGQRIIFLRMWGTLDVSLERIQYSTTSLPITLYKCQVYFSKMKDITELYQQVFNS